MADILTSADSKEGITKTRLMCEAYLSFTQLREYLSLLLENGMIAVEDRKYKTTSKGIKMLAAMKTTNNMFSRRENQDTDPYR